MTCRGHGNGHLSGKEHPVVPLSNSKCCFFSVVTFGAKLFERGLTVSIHISVVDTLHLSLKEACGDLKNSTLFQFLIRFNFEIFSEPFEMGTVDELKFVID